MGLCTRSSRAGSSSSTRVESQLSPFEFDHQVVTGVGRRRPPSAASGKRPRWLTPRDRIAALVYLLWACRERATSSTSARIRTTRRTGLSRCSRTTTASAPWYWSATRGRRGPEPRRAVQPGSSSASIGRGNRWRASEVDGGDALFGPFFDYEYSKNGAEALEKWGEERLVRELVRAIRLVQPQVVISRWRGDESDGHGHHTAVGIAVQEAFVAAGDPARFADLEDGRTHSVAAAQALRGHDGGLAAGRGCRARVLRRPDLERDGCLRLNTGGFDPIAGLTYEEQGALALNEHLTQGVGTIPAPGDYYVYLRLIDVAPGSELIGACSLYDGLDPTLTALADYPGDGADELRGELAELAEIAQSAAAGFQVDKPWQTGTVLIELARRLDELVAQLERLAPSEPARKALARYLRRKYVEATEAAAACLGIRVEADLENAIADAGRVGATQCRLWNFGLETPTEVEFHPTVALAGADGAPLDGSSDGLSAEFEIAVPADAELTTPYWLRSPGDEYSYAWPEVPYARRGVRSAADPGHLHAPRRGPRARADAPRRAAPRSSSGGTASSSRRSCRRSPLEASTARFLRAPETAHNTGAQRRRCSRTAMSPIAGVVEVEVPEGWTVDPARAEVVAQQGRRRRTASPSA